MNNVRFVGLEVTDKKWTIVIKFIYSEIILDCALTPLSYKDSDGKAN